MSKNARKKSPHRSGRTPLTKTMLLPPTPERVREVSLRNHLALAAWRSGAGNRALLHELFVALYLSYFLGEAGFGDETRGFYQGAQEALDRCIARAAIENDWGIEPEDSVVLEQLLRLYDQQLAAAPRYVTDGARKRLLRFADSDESLPW
jgi:hypothetical protein